MRWLNNQGKLGWPLDRFTAPEPKDKTQQKHQQAIVLEPPMLAHLEEKIERLQRVKDPAWMALLGSWLVGAGWLRYRSAHPVR